MSLFDDIDGLLPGLLPSAWRNQRFWVINAQHSVGRRIQQVLYPGLDLKTHDDAGPLDGPIRISGLVIGDDYVEQAQALHAAFRQAGPGTLIHPWRGPITCVLFRPATIEFDVKELRVARIDAEFDPVGPKASIVTSLSAALAALTGLGGTATALARFVLQAQPVAAAIRGRAIAAVATGLDVAGDWSGRSTRAASLLPAIANARQNFALAAGLADRATGAAALAGIVPATVATLGQVYRPQPASGLGAGDAAATPAIADPRAGTGLMRALAADLGRRLRPAEAAVAGLSVLAPEAYPTSVPERAVLLAAEVAALTEAAGLTLLIPFESRQEAQTRSGALDLALRRAQTSAAALAQELAAPASALWRGLGDTRARLSLDLSEIAGRLPAAQRLEPPARASAFLLAQHLAGDDPGAVIAFAQDIVRRNRLRHPATLGGGPIEVLL
ncbi:MAG TPA: DNA circularization N-terminal domain-containing protein [Bosea sp. (in: a-proteobacteria)]|jgi:prophage DNA circulation protein|uniref:DNA circularization N-terminal domain-containing protein n=1 Tax=Bosea sp. (in: a-proteobacteria) TaxID=1871050 RepID=UPI002DDD261E|nr:DNA circularization N-terminal domain-containing protein [Bosea sp. (in: a-proteobacteria)]HEV2556804.1 DNA circularization N-terminal domain-containing protein [Bosea sp. (in: a-proteobacteria)]